jgi:hypothetical protein
MRNAANRKTPNRPAGPCDLHGKWRIVDLQRFVARRRGRPAFIEFDGAGGGLLALGELRAILACVRNAGSVDFHWCGWDDGRKVGGEGWVEVQLDGSLLGEVAYANGNATIMRARPWRRRGPGAPPAAPGAIASFPD